MWNINQKEALKPYGVIVLHEESNIKIIIKSWHSSSAYSILIFYLLVLIENIFTFKFSVLSFQFSTIGMIPLYINNNKYYYVCTMLGYGHFSAGWSNISARHIEYLTPSCYSYFLFAIRRQFHILLIRILVADDNFCARTLVWMPAFSVGGFFPYLRFW